MCRQIPMLAPTYALCRGRLAVLIAAGLTAFVFGHHPATDHHHTIARLLVVLAVSVAIVTLSTALSWGIWRRHAPTRRFMRADWRTRRRVGRALRKGKPIAEGDLEAAHALIDLLRGRGWVTWLYLTCAALQLCAAAAGHGDARWLQLATGIAYLALAPYWLWNRHRILRREADLPA
jgi:hypothetical protein